MKLVSFIELFGCVFGMDKRVINNMITLHHGYVYRIKDKYYLQEEWCREYGYLYDNVITVNRVDEVL